MLRKLHVLAILVIAISSALITPVFAVEKGVIHGQQVLQANYECQPTDKENLKTLQNDIHQRINYLNENNLDSYSDSKLLEFYEQYSQIEGCIFQDHTDQYFLIAVIAIVIPLLVYIRWQMISKGAKSKPNL